MTTFAIRTPTWTLLYRGVNITADVSTMVMAISYVDRLSDYSGECEVTFDDRDKVWQGPWYPSIGDEVSVTVGYAGDALLKCGDFQVDEVHSSGPPDQMALRCIAAWITPAMRTRKSVAYEGVTLPEVAAMVASQYGYAVSGAPSEPNVRFERITQRHESDLAFLKRLAQAHGYNFTVRGSQFIFYAISSLEGATSGITTRRSDVREFAFLDKTFRVYRGSNVTYQSPLDKLLITRDAMAPEQVGVGDTFRCVRRCENEAQAALKAQAELERHNRYQNTVGFTMEGRTYLLAGNTVNLEGFGQNSGTYLIDAARHRIERRTGYTTQVKAHRIAS